MESSDLYAQILGVASPWRVDGVTLETEDSVEISLSYDGPARCPKCESRCPRYDTRQRRFRHLDTCQLKTILCVDIPRVDCKKHGVLQVRVPWAEEGSRFTMLFEALAIDWMKGAPMTKVAHLLRCSWDELDGIVERAVRRGMARRKHERPKHISVDETSFQKRHEYVTVVAQGGKVLHVADGRKTGALESFFAGQSERDLAGIESVSMDMWSAYINATRAYVPDADRKICFDRFHVAKHLGEAVNAVRKSEHRELRHAGDDRLKGTRYLWLQNPEGMSEARHEALDELKNQSLKVARAWALKEMARGLWKKTTRAWAHRRWQAWLSWAVRCRLGPMKKAAKMVKAHLFGIKNAIVLGRSNGIAESLNAGIQRIKRMACGFRNRDRFRRAIYFHLGGLDLYPRAATHSIS